MWVYISGTFICLFLVGIALAIAVWKSLNRYQNDPAPFTGFPSYTPVVQPCGGTNPNWQGHQEDYESPFARETRIKEETERARVYGWDKLHRPTSIIEP